MSTVFAKFDKRAALVIFLIVLVCQVGGCTANKPVVSDASNGQQLTDSKRITDITASEDDSSYLILVNGNRQLTYTSVKQNLPLGILFYFQDTQIDDTVEPLVFTDNEIIDSIEVSPVNDKQDMSRLLISLKQDIPYEVTAEGNGIRISFVKPIGEKITDDEVTTDKADTSSETIVAEPIQEVTPTTKIASRIEGIDIHDTENQARINVTADGAIKDFKIFTLDKPARVVFDMPQLKSPSQGEQVIQADSNWVRQVRYFGYPKKIRMVIDTHSDYLKSYSAVSTPTGLLVQIGTGGAVVASAPAEVAEITTTSDDSSSEKPVESSMSLTEEMGENQSKTAWINRLDFITEDDGQSTLIIGTTRPVTYDLNNTTDRLLQLKMHDTKLPKYRDRPLITTRFESAVNRITPVQKKTLPDTTLVAIELREAVSYDVEQEDDVLMIRFGASSIPPKPLEQADLPDWKQVLAQTEVVAEDDVPSQQVKGQALADQSTTMTAQVSKETPTAMEILGAEVPSNQPSLPGTMAMTVGTPMSASMPSYNVSKRYTGEKIALDFYETDIKNVFRIIREISGKNFAIDKDVTGTVTLTLEKPVPWDQVLDLVLKMNRLGMVYEGDIIRIATISTLTAEEKAKQDQIAAEQKSREVVKALEPLVTEYIAVNYSDAGGEVLPLIQKVLTKNRGSVSVDQRNNQLIVTDTAAKIGQIKEIVSRIDTVTPQVIIEAKVVEVSDEFTLELGIDWQMAWGPTGSILGGAFGGDVAMNFPSASSSTVGFNFTKLGGTPLTLEATLNAVEANKQGRIITAPKIVTLDNKKAKIKQGVEWPYLERDSSGNATVKFKNIDLLLEVTPTVTPDDRILMKIFITKNDIGVITLGVPSLNTNEAQTELLVNDGDTIVIGGIIKKNEQESVTGWPGVKNIPLVGWLFKTATESQTNQELLIFITPRIVQLEQRHVL
jgi:type IV pilus assembly protein PilQ